MSRLRGAVEVAFQFGSNVGDKVDNVARAARLLEAAGIARDLRLSTLYRTPPWGGVPQDWFVNACAVGMTALPPRDLLRRVKAVEVALGRVETVRWGPRVIDIDILYRGEDSVDTPELTLPHRDVLNRGFVLVPLAELVPERIIRGVRIADAAARADVAGIVRLSGES
ncbi:2-amino-4-hydroxy-6-hydroxymethyldihydropteridine diphosphokinase [Lichenibacterium ramalinae]|uniref:2-amino-4-hydroxy-6- hydroxymethyldihydropteridine diphosphokinase n=1 Tax=Lichenibacterium ramalinae TaxID=2316527 RepID=UPI001FE20F23|nr:2-amino-4-hydroxy-6-hydroxymethyldihydropteridine diphosphokinase [Lichenibacterium ramalinae]